MESRPRIVEPKFRMLLKEIETTVAQSGSISNPQLLMLNFLFPNLACSALDLVDRERVICYSEPTSRRVYQIRMSAEQIFTILGPTDFCPCDVFEEEVLNNSKELLCKHLLAVHLAKAMLRLRQIPSTEIQLAQILSAAFF